MFSLFSTREIAVGIWLIIFGLFVLLWPKSRVTATQIVKIACSRHLFFPFVVILIYTLIIALLFTLLPIWKTKYIKDIVIWVLFAGVPACFKAVIIDANSNYFKNILFDNLTLVVLVEFLVSSFTFNLWTELILIPSLSLLFMIHAFATMKGENIQVKRLVSLPLYIVGFIVLSYTLKNAINAYTELSVVDLLISFSIPIILSTLYIPVAYSFALCSKYQNVFVCMGFKEPNDKKTRRMHRLALIKECRLSYKKICVFEKEFIHQIYVAMSAEEFDDLIKRFRNLSSGITP